MTVLAFLLAYLLGSLPAGAWVARLRGVDIQKVGSGNTGATNVQRVLGWGPALIVALFDISKGALVVWLAQAFFSPMIAAYCGAFAVLGHNFSVFLGFRGGKGVATSFGTLAAISPVVALGTCLVGLFCIMITRYVSAGSMVGAVTALFLAWALPEPSWRASLISALALLLIFQHRSNLLRLQRGSESRFGEKKA